MGRQKEGRGGGRIAQHKEQSYLSGGRRACALACWGSPALGAGTPAALPVSGGAWKSGPTRRGGPVTHNSHSQDTTITHVTGLYSDAICWIQSPVRGSAADIFGRTARNRIKNRGVPPAGGVAAAPAGWTGGAPPPVPGGGSRSPRVAAAPGGGKPSHRRCMAAGGRWPHSSLSLSVQQMCRQ